MNLCLATFIYVSLAITSTINGFRLMRLENRFHTNSGSLLLNGQLARRNALHLASSDDELASLKLDKSKLAAKERERLDYIQKVTAEADELAKAAGFTLGDEDDDYDDFNDDAVEKEVRDTQWSGQSNVEETSVSLNNWNDVIDRPILAVGDAVALLLFATIGRSNHGENVDLFADLVTALPFLTAWFLISPLLGSYSRSATAVLGKVPQGLALGWASSLPVALAIRGLSKGEIPPTPFIIVAMIATFTLLSLWRVLYIAAFGETSDDEFRRAGFLEVFKMVGTLVKRW